MCGWYSAQGGITWYGTSGEQKHPVLVGVKPCEDVVCVSARVCTKQYSEFKSLRPQLLLDHKVDEDQSWWIDDPWPEVVSPE